MNLSELLVKLKLLPDSTSVTISWLTEKPVTLPATEFKYAKVETPVFTPMMLWTTEGVNFRPLPTLKSAFETLPGGTLVTQLSDKKVFADNWNWVNVRFSNQTGWIADKFLTSKKPEIVPPAPARKNIMGFHILPGGAGEELIGLYKQHPFAAVTVVNNKSLANRLVNAGVPYVVYREADGNQGIIDAPDFNGVANPYKYGFDWMLSRAVWLNDLDPRVYVQPVNEPKWTVGTLRFWDGLLDARDRFYASRKLVLFSWAIGNPDDDQGGPSAVSKFLNLRSIFSRGKRSGDLLGIHIYSERGTPAGELSRIEARPYYELRFQEFYKQLSAAEQIGILVGEAASEFEYGLFQGTGNAVKYARELNALLLKNPNVVGICYWTLGKWNKADVSIDPALSELVKLATAGRSL